MNLFDRPLPEPLERERVAQDVAAAIVPTCECVIDKSYSTTWFGPCLDGKMHRATCQHAGAAEAAQRDRLRAASLALQPPSLPTVPKTTTGLRRVSHSELAAAQLCWRLHYYSYRLRREPRVTATPLVVGKRVEKIIKQIWLGQEPDLSELPPEERAICKAYPIWWRHHTLRVTRVDIKFQVEIAGVLYVGEFDGDGEDKREEVIVELKTTSKDIAPGSAYWRSVSQVDPQVTIYLRAAQAQGRKVKRVVYDVIRKTTIERARATPFDKRKYTKATKTNPVPQLYANMREHDETDDEYELRVLEDIAGKPEKYFQRHDIVRYESEHQAHLRDVAGVVQLMQAVEQMPEPPRSMGPACFKYGSACPYMSVCLEEDRIDNNITFQDKRRTRWGIWWVSEGSGIAMWEEEHQGKIHEFASREEAEKTARDRVVADTKQRADGYFVMAKTWEAREITQTERKK